MLVLDLVWTSFHMKFLEDGILKYFEVFLCFRELLILQLLKGLCASVASLCSLLYELKLLFL